MNFRDKLTARQEEIDSVLCTGLDPLVEKIPASVLPGEADDARVLKWMTDIIDATAEHTSLYKLQSASYEAFEGGMDVAFKILAYIRESHPGIPVIIDAKRGDIGRTQEQYRKALLDGSQSFDGFDGMTFAPYMGKDCMEFLYNRENPEKALIGLCHTSNPSSREVQDVRVGPEKPYWAFMAERLVEWGTNIGVGENMGLVVAAAYDRDGEIYVEHLQRIRDFLVGRAWMLIPGIGTQGGYIAETIKNAYAGPGSIAVNSSSGIIMASDGEDYAEVAGKKASELKMLMRHAALDAIP